MSAIDSYILEWCHGEGLYCGRSPFFLDKIVNKRQFLKTSGAFLTSTLLPRFASGEPQAGRTNWAGNLTYHTDILLTPKTAEEAQQMVRSTPKLRALGSRHCFNAIADSTAAQISLKDLDSMVIDADAETVTVGAGVRYGILAPYIDKA